jgi:hypothetical protein
VATTTILLADLEAGKVPRICVKNGLPAEVGGRFTFGKPSHLSWVSGTFGCACLIVLALPVSTILVPAIALGALYVRHRNGVFELPMTRGAAWRLSLGRWGGWVLLAAIFTAVVAASIVPRVQEIVGPAGPNVLLVAAVAWVVAAVWVVLLTADYLQPGGSVPLVGIQGLLMEGPVGPYVELRGVHPRFAEAVYTQYHP